MREVLPNESFAAGEAAQRYSPAAWLGHDAVEIVVATLNGYACGQNSRWETLLSNRPHAPPGHDALLNLK